MRTLGILLIGLGLLAGRLTTDVKPVRAQQGCSASSLMGPFVYRLDGNYFDNQGYSYQYSAVGKMVTDGNGAITGTETNSNWGTVTRNVTYTGSYTVNNDCTGSIVLKYSGGSLNYDIVFIPSTNQVNMIQTDQGITITGTATAQFAPTPTPAPAPVVAQ